MSLLFPCFNRTSVELKREKKAVQLRPRRSSFNRTSVELKRNILRNNPTRPCFALIEPVWN